ncbi:MAG: hypothetical protein WAM14_23280 [Candidatus Nitrosopolaris sp.]
MFGITRYNKPRETLEELEVNMVDAVQLILASIYEEAHEKKKMQIEVSV